MFLFVCVKVHGTDTALQVEVLVQKDCVDYLYELTFHVPRAFLARSHRRSSSPALRKPHRVGRATLLAIFLVLLMWQFDVAQAPS